MQYIALYGGRRSDFFRLPILWHLLNVKDEPATDRLVRLEDIRGGDMVMR